MRTTHASLAIASALLLAAPTALAQDPAAPPEPAPIAPTTTDPAAAPAAAPVADAPQPESADPALPPFPEGDRGLFVAGGKFGMIASFNGLDPNITGAVQVGYIGPWLDRGLGLMVDVGYSAPVTSEEKVADPRVEGGVYTWHLVQKELTVAPSLYYRYTGLGHFVPFVGAGPRIYFLEGVTDSDEQTPLINETTEQSTKVGLGIHAGTEYLLGPGGIVGELLFQWAELDHTMTGESSLAGLNVWFGYRFML